MKKNDKFSFNISLSVLNHLGRNLYRSFVTVLGEAISNSWDADAENVWIYIDKKNNNFLIKDDGIGMSRDDFQNKFLKIGYSKRKEGKNKSDRDRPFIGRKGIGKLALLSCAAKITVISKTTDGKYIGGEIDNSGLDRAITQDLNPQQYPLGQWEPNLFERYIKGHEKGTIIHFESIKDGIKNSLSLIKQVIALYFRFSLIDEAFNIYVDDELITYEHLNKLSEKTEFLWKINKFDDPYIQESLQKVIATKTIKVKDNIVGFIASVTKPRDLKIFTFEERISVDLFVNGRLREKDILRHIPTARITESYLYGQVHFNELDDDTVDRFTSSREGIVADDPEYQKFLELLRKEIITVILDDWDKLRIKSRKDGDSENERITIKERKSRELFNVVSEEYTPLKGSKNKKQIDDWVDDLANDADYNFTSYAECFISENLIRKYITANSLPLSTPAQNEIKEMKRREALAKGQGNISIEIRRKNTEIGYLSMNHLANLVDKKDKTKKASLSRDANEYKPIRDAVAHTALLTDIAKQKLNSVYENIKGRIKALLAGNG